MDDALQNLAKLNPQHSQIVELRFFGGMTIEEVAEVLDVSPRTVQREWRWRALSDIDADRCR